MVTERQGYRLVVELRAPSESTEPDKYMAEIPALPGCRAWGDTPSETVEIVLSLALEFVRLGDVPQDAVMRPVDDIWSYVSPSFDFLTPPAPGKCSSVEFTVSA